MKNLFISIKLTTVCLVFFAILYSLLITGIAKMAPNKGRGEILEKNGKVVGFKKYH